jgi:TniQ protein
MPETPPEADGLVRHPPPYPTESLFGYVLRLAEENGYTTPSSVLALIGIKKTQLKNRHLRLRRLARIAHRESCELARIAYVCNASGQYCLVGHPVGRYELP